MNKVITSIIKRMSMDFRAAPAASVGPKEIDNELMASPYRPCMSPYPDRQERR